MKGTWKENLGGWNHKDSKRKKQTRNNTLHDNGLYFSIKEPKKSVRLEGEVEVIEDTITKHGETKTVYQVRIQKWYCLGEYHYSYRKAYSEGRGYYKIWYDALTHTFIDWPNQNIQIVKELWTEYTHYNEPKTYTSGYRFGGRWGGTNELMFVYDKPVYDYKRWSFDSDSPRRKYAQKMVSKINRAKVREYISRGDWDKDIKTHALSKSIAWEIH